MWEEVLKAFSLVYVPSTLKFIFGPFGGKAAGLHMVTTMIATMAGMMTMVILFTYFGEYVRKLLTRFFRKNKPAEKSNPKYVEWIRKYGLGGVAFLTPVIFTPIGGTLLAVGLSTNREKILLYMFISACFWAIVLTLAVYFGYDAIVRFVKQIQPI